ncbi:MAG: tRNA uridine-5-carboxymethylaminomethyl(34) synthesis GTPase MnmE [Clostridia bacterium]|nr:tRNA uridine-5-carboxymethylaminomethyl(34) synthesis GTPase MnmE [Clostridia bacterium]
MSVRTIAAIATPLGEGGISVIRISGEDAISIADKCFYAFSGKALSALDGYMAAYGKVVDNNGSALDDAVALVFRAPKSYTGENVVEISVHGGTVIARQVLRRVLECGAVLATGGEFTKRAFLNGKLDLTKAESVMGLISARNDAAAKISRGAREGRISRDTQDILNKLLETAASLAAFADYPDEDIPNLNEENFAALLDECRFKCEKLISTYDTGRIIREGINCAIVGKPNVGKSTLMNLLCGSDRSIVTDIAGTTRDVVETTINIGDVTLNLADTAGIHDTNDTVEKFGVDKAKEKIDNAELLLAVFDNSSAIDNDDRQLLGSIKDKKCIIILNKTDLPQQFDKQELSCFETIEISAREGNGMAELCSAINRVCKLEMLSPDDTVLINERQRDCVNRALNAVVSASDALAYGMTLDAVGVCIDDAIAALLELTGKRVTNEVCDEIFKRFCVGK